jgi:phage shock protein A
MVWQLNEKIDAKDSTINIYIAKEENYLKQTATYEKAMAVQDEVIKGLEKDVTDLTRKNTNLKRGIKWLGGGFVSSILIILTLVTIK